MNCPNCGTHVPSEDINIVRLVAKCQNCDEIFSFGDSDQSMTAPGTGSVRDVPKPPNLHVETIGQRLTISYRWFHWMYFFLLFFCIGWDSFLIFWYLMALHMPGPAALIMVLFPTIHLAVGVALTYVTISGFLNSTRISADRSFLEIQHGPLPWWGSRKIPTDQLNQLFCRGQHRSRKSNAMAYSIHAILNNGDRVDLLSHVQDRDLVLYLEKAIEDHLGIEDRPVAGELEK